MHGESDNWDSVTSESSDDDSVSVWDVSFCELFVVQCKREREREKYIGERMWYNVQYHHLNFENYNLSKISKDFTY